MPDYQFTGQATELQPNARLFLYSDGLLHRPGTTATHSTVELARAASEAASGGALPPGAPAPTAPPAAPTRPDRLSTGRSHSSRNCT